SLQPTSHAMEGSSCFSALVRVSWLLSVVVRRRGASGGVEEGTVDAALTGGRLLPVSPRGGNHTKPRVTKSGETGAWIELPARRKCRGRVASVDDGGHG